MNCYYSRQKSPYFISKNIFDLKTLELMKDEFFHLSNFFRNNELKESRDNDISRRNASGLFLSSHYNNYTDSCIMKTLVNILTSEKYYTNIENDWVKKLYKNIKNMSFLANYYQEDNYYNKHHDNTIFTTIFCLEKNCLGGDFFLGDESNVIDLEENSMVTFIGTEWHGVLPIQSGSRSSIAVFMT